MTAVHAPTPDPIAASPAAEVAGPGHRPVPWSVVLAAAGSTAVVPVIAMLAVAGAPDSASDWAALGGPVAVGVAVVLSRRWVEAAAIVLALASALLVPAGDAALETSQSWSSAAGVVLYLGVCWVTCTLGLRLPLARSLGWVVAVLLGAWWGLGFDVPVLLGTAWWLVGRALRDRQQVADRLRARAAELAAERDRVAAEAVRLERARIARELHDVLAHCMTVIVIQARAGRQLLDDDPAGVPDAFGAIAAAAREASTDLAALVTVIEADAHPRLAETLRALVDRASDTGTSVRLDLLGDLTELTGARGTVAVRAVREALTNALRHAPGSAVEVILDCREPASVTVRNGSPAGSGPTTSGSGRGLDGLRDRVTELGGTAAWGPTGAGGWRVTVTLPRTDSDHPQDLAAAHVPGRVTHVDQLEVPRPR